MTARSILLASLVAICLVYDGSQSLSLHRHIVHHFQSCKCAELSLNADVFAYDLL